MIVGLVRRHQRRDVAQDEKFAGAGVEDGLGRDARIAAADDHRFGRLAPDRQLFESVVIGQETPANEGLIALNERFRQTGRAERLLVIRHLSFPSRASARSTSARSTLAKFALAKRMADPGVIV